MSGRSQEEWGQLLKQYRLSKESAKTFCERHKITTSALYYWLDKDKKKAVTAVSMLPVISHQPEAKPVDEVELRLPKGLSLRFGPGASARYVADIVKALW